MTKKHIPVKGVDKGSNGDKDSDDKDDPREEDARDAVEKQDQDEFLIEEGEEEESGCIEETPNKTSEHDRQG